MKLSSKTIALVALSSAILSGVNALPTHAQTTRASANTMSSSDKALMKKMMARMSATEKRTFARMSMSEKMLVMKMVKLGKI
jgi:hypothetical protein